MKTKYGDLVDYKYEDLDLQYEYEEIDLSSIEHDQASLLPWCPLFGELPYNNQPSACQITKCIDIIEAARDLWGAFFYFSMDSPELEKLNKLEKFIECNSWVTANELQPFYPKGKLLLARNLFIVWEKIKGLTEKDRKLPYKYDLVTTPSGKTIMLPSYMSKELSETPEDAMLGWFNTLPSGIEFKDLKAWHVFSILAIYEARKVLNVSLYAHEPTCYYSKAKWFLIEEFEENIDIVRQVQSATDILHRAEVLKQQQKVSARAEKITEGRQKQLRDEIHPTWTDWQTRAEKIWGNNPIMSKNTVAENIRQQLVKEGTSPIPSVNTIRRRINKPT